jgi:imidazolonepropionase-like amidohydrolase
MTDSRPARALAAAASCAIALAAGRSLALGADAARGSAGLFAITGGTVVVGDGRVLPGATVIVRDRVIDAVGKGIKIPAGTPIVDAQGRFVYPGLIDALAEPPAAPAKAGDTTAPRLLPLYAQVKAADTLPGDEAAADWRSAGVLAANVAPARGIFRGQSALVNLGGEASGRIVKAPAVMNVSLQGLGYRNRVPGMGEPGGEFPTRLIGVFGFVRQTMLDARTLEETVAAGQTVPPELDKPEVRPSLEALRAVARRELPVILPAKEDREIRRALALAEELRVDAVVAGAHDASAMAATLRARNVPVLVSLDFPAPEKDVHPDFRVPLRVLHEWQQAPRTAAALSRAGVRMAFYSDGLGSGAAYLAALRRVVREGMPRDAALRAATLGAAEILGVARQLGSIAPGKLANLVVTEGDLFDGTSRIRQVYVAGQAYEPVASAGPSNPARIAAAAPVSDPFEGLVPDLGRVILIKNANVMTVSHGTLKGASLLIRDGKIAALGTDVTAPAGARVVDGTDKWITPGFVDCHSHIATDSHNESGSNITAMTGTPDTINPHDIPIYRTLAAGVTTANVLHGSVNPIGGRTIVIKNRWGHTAPEMVFEGAKPGQKFAVKEFGPRRGISPPSSLMGDEALMRDAFTRARHYAKGWDEYKALVAAGKAPKVAPRRDLTLEALAEILRGDRFLHVHTYTPEEMLVVLRVAQDFGFKVRTLQHATYGWKIAPEIKRMAGAGASIFADLGGANPYTASILTRAGVLVSVNSDGEDLARHFNHDVARLKKHGDLTEDEALALITLNPAKQLAIDDRVGSIDVGKDADLVVFNKYPLSVYAVPETVFIDGKVYYSREAERERERRVEAARRLLAGGAKEVSDAR